VGSEEGGVDIDQSGDTGRLIELLRVGMRLNQFMGTSSVEI